MSATGIKSLRPFLGSRNYTESREFYRAIGFNELELRGGNMCFFSREGFGFYLQDAYEKKWVENTMVFLEVEDLDSWKAEFDALDLPARFKDVRVSRIVVNDWGDEFFVHDPAGNLWHVGSFKG